MSHHSAAAQGSSGRTSRGASTSTSTRRAGASSSGGPWSSWATIPRSPRGSASRSSSRCRWGKAADASPSRP
eukprot:235805-Lingulodinium_polyedra.AAC.1